MIRGILFKTVRETWVMVLACGVALLIVKVLLNLVLPQLQAGMNEIFMQLPFVRTLIAALIGTDLGDGFTAPMLQSVMWVHPVVLALLWVLEIVFCTRVPVGEIDRGTIDVLLGWPISRRRLYCCESAVCLAAGAVVLLLGMLGHRLADSLDAAQMPRDWAATWLVAANLACVYVAVAGFAYLVSSLSERRGRALAVIFGFVLASFLLNFLAQFWAPASKIAFLGLLRYYQPALVVRTGTVPLDHVAVLLGFGVATWALGGEIMARRSICTV